MRVLVSAGSRMGPEGPGPRVRPARAELDLGMACLQAVVAAGACPAVLPPGVDPVPWLDCAAAVLVAGGAFDIHPRRYGRAPAGRLDRVDEERTATELALVRACIRRDLPVLGICGGMQLLAVAAGGWLVQDIAAEIPGALEHEQPTDPALPWHPVRLERGRLREAMGGRARVNSTHHQAVSDPGGLAVAGRAPDGVIEAVRLPGHRFCLGVQWHPELLDPAPIRLLLEAAGEP